MANDDRKPEADSKLRWKTVREVGLTLIAGIVAVMALWFMRRPLPPPPGPPIPPPSPTAPSAPPLQVKVQSTDPSVQVTAPASESMIIAVGKQNGVTEYSERYLGNEYGYTVEYMALLKKRDPELYAWAKQEWYESEAQRTAADNAGAPAGQPQHHMAGATSWGQPLHHGDTLVVAKPPERTDAEREAGYQAWYAVLVKAHDEALATKRLHEQYEARLKAQGDAGKSAATK